MPAIVNTIANGAIFLAKNAPLFSTDCARRNFFSSNDNFCQLSVLYFS